MNRKLYPIATIALLLSACGLRPFAPTTAGSSATTSHTHTTSQEPSSHSTSEISSSESSSSSSKTSESTITSTPTSTPTSQSTSESKPTSESTSQSSTPTSESTTTAPQPTSESTTTAPQPTSESTTTVPPAPTSETTTTIPPAPTSESTTTIPPAPTSETTTTVPPAPTSESTTIIPPTPTSESSSTIPEPPSTSESSSEVPPAPVYTTVTEALGIISALEIGQKTSESYTVIGKITTAINTMASGLLQFSIGDLDGSSGRLYINGASCAVGTPVKTDTVVVTGQLERYAESKYYMSRNCAIVDINPSAGDKFTATFYDETGSLLESKLYNANEVPSYTYVKPSTADTDYITKGWSLTLGGEVTTIQPITKNISYYAVIEAKPYQFIGNVYSEFQIHFLELGSWYTGDCVYIKAGDNDILIDAGSRQASAATIKEYLNDHNLVADGKFEYIIATHAHQDHIAGFVGTGSPKNGILYSYEVDNIIQFARHDTTSSIYNAYAEAVTTLQAGGTNVKTALEIYNDVSTRTISLGTNMSMTTLYQKYYEESSDSENNYSVCTLFTYGSQNYLFTGDLESPGETSLVNSNTLPRCELYKGGHHGSKTSSTATLMSAIQPKIVCVCCCCGNDEYTTTNVNQFPTQEFVNRVGIYTQYIFVTTISTNNEEKEYSSMNGNIIFSSNGLRYGLNCSNNNTILKDTDWFKANRTWPSAS